MSDRIEKICAARYPIKYKTDENGKADCDLQKRLKGLARIDFAKKIRKNLETMNEQAREVYLEGLEKQFIT